MKKFQLDSNGMKKLTQNLLMELVNDEETAIFCARRIRKDYFTID